jgi:hypothetical protein
VDAWRKSVDKDMDAKAFQNAEHPFMGNGIMSVFGTQ